MKNRMLAIQSKNSFVKLRLLGAFVLFFISVFFRENSVVDYTVKLTATAIHFREPSPVRAYTVRCTEVALEEKGIKYYRNKCF